MTDDERFTIVWWGACVDCSGQFYRTAGETAHYDSKASDDGQALPYPVRCRECREHRRLLRAERAARNIPTRPRILC